MPLKPGFSKRIIGSNIQELLKVGKPLEQAQAIALGEARKFENKKKMKFERLFKQLNPKVSKKHQRDT